MSREQRPRRRLRSWLRLDDEQPRPKRRRSTARRDQSPDPSGEDLLDAWAAGWPEEWIDEYGVRQGGRDGYGWKRLGEL